MKMKFIFAASILALMTTSCNDDDDNTKTDLFPGNEIMGKASITREKSSKKATLDIDINGDWDLYVGPSVERIDLSLPVLSGNKKGKYPIDIDNTYRSYFQLVTQEGKALLAERCLPLDSCYHFRDMGGYKTTDGKLVKWGKVFRTDEFKSINDADLEYLNTLPLRTIVDFRSKEEAKGHPNLQPASVKAVHDLNISIGNITGILTGMGAGLYTITREEIIEIMSDTYRQFVTEDECIDRFKSLFELLQNEDNLPLVYNCSIGKDRTGIVSYLFLTSLGVSEKVALEDYLLTNSYNVADKYAAITTLMPALKPLFEANETYINAAITQIKEDHGSIENFLTNQLNVDLAKMKSIYLY